MMKLLCIVLSLLGTFPCIQAQTITGTVIDEINQPVEFANVVLLSLPDSTFVQGTISDQTGGFVLAFNGKSSVIRISSVGYATTYATCNMGNLGTIQLHSDTQLLGEVVVKADLPKTKLKGDALVTNIHNSVLAKAGSANDVLAKVPGLQGKDGSFTVFGKGEPLFYINGRLVRDKSELEQLHSSMIKEVEVITNPGAQYDASVKAVVLIKTMKSAGEGLGLNARTSHMYGEHYFGVNQLDFNYRQKGLDVLGSLFYSGGEDGTNIVIDQQTFVDTLWTQRSEASTVTQRNNYKARLGVNYMFNEQHAIGFLYDFAYRTTDEPNYHMNTEIIANHKFYDEWKSLNMIKTQSPVHSVNMYYAGNVGKLSINFNTDLRWSYNKQDQTTDELSENFDSRVVSTKSRYDNGLFASKLVLGYPLWIGNLAIGGEYTHTYQENQFENPQNILSNTDNEVKESNVSAFLEYRLHVEKFNAGLGVRYEHNISDYYENGKIVEMQSKAYDNLFPFASVAYPFGKVYTQLSYTMKTQRPTYAQLDGNMSYINRFTYSSGNPLLRPTKQSDLTFISSYSFWQLVASYQHVKDPLISVTNQYKNQPNISHKTIENFNKINKFSLILSASPTMGKWNINYSVGAMKQWFSLIHLDSEKKLQRIIPYFSLFNTYTLPLDFLVNLDMVYNGKGNMNNILMCESKYIDVGVGKSLLGDKSLFVKLECFDIFNWKRYNVYAYGARNIFHENDNWSDSRRIQLTVRYNFNSSKSKYKGTSAGEAEKARL